MDEEYGETVDISLDMDVEVIDETVDIDEIPEDVEDVGTEILYENDYEYDIPEDIETEEMQDLESKYEEDDIAEDIEAEDIEAEDIEAEDIEAEDIEAEDIEAEDIEAEGTEAEGIEAEDIETEGIGRTDETTDVLDTEITEQAEVTEIQEGQNCHPITDTKNAFEFADQMYDKKSPHWQEAANRQLDNLTEEMNAIETSIKEAESSAGQKYAEMRDYINSNGLDKDTSSENTYYQGLVQEYREAQAKYSSLSDRYKNCSAEAEDISRNIIPEMRTTFRGMHGSDFSSSYNDYITEPQGRAVEGFKGVCGINETCSIVNQQTGSDLDEADGVREYTSKGLCVTDCSDMRNGGTTPMDRKQFLESKGLTFDRREGSVLGEGFTLDEIASRFQSGESAGLMLKAQDLSQPELSNRSMAVEFMDAMKNKRKVEDPESANHATTIAGFSYDQREHVTGVWINDTGNWAGSNRIFIDERKFMQMQEQTKGFAVEFSRKR